MSDRNLNSCRMGFFFFIRLSLSEGWLFWISLSRGRVFFVSLRLKMVRMIDEGVIILGLRFVAKITVRVVMIVLKLRLIVF